MSKKSVTEIVDVFDRCFGETNRQCITLTWTDFYELSGRMRLKSPFLTSVKETASGRYQLIVAVGRNVVLVSHDRNFAPVSSDDILPNSALDDIVEELNEQMRLAQKPCITMNWGDFYKLCDKDRFHQSFLDEVQRKADSEYQLIVAYGRYVVIVCLDRNFASVPLV